MDDVMDYYFVCVKVLEGLFEGFVVGCGWNIGVYLYLVVGGCLLLVWIIG